MLNNKTAIKNTNCNGIILIPAVWLVFANYMYVENKMFQQVSYWKQCNHLLILPAAVSLWRDLCCHFPPDLSPWHLVTEELGSGEPGGCGRGYSQTRCSPESVWWMGTLLCTCWDSGSAVRPTFCCVFIMENVHHDPKGGRIVDDTGTELETGTVELLQYICVLRPKPSWQDCKFVCM